jgi:glycosyltransferase involved in cell wall biosynthesis
MHVLHVTRDYPPRSCGGISTAVSGLARAQARAGLRVAVLSFDAWRPRHASATRAPPPVERRAGVTVFRLSSPVHLDAARGFARAQRPTLLHVHHGMLWSFAAELRTLCAVPAVKTVHVVQRQMNALRGTRERTLSLAGQDTALAAADRIIAPSRAAADLLLTANPQLAARLRVVGHGIDDTRTARAAAARQVGAAARGPLLAVGRFDEVKGTPELFEVLRLVLARLPGATAVVAGGVPANRRGEERWMRSWRAHSPEAVQARVRFTGWLGPVALAAWYRKAAVLVLSSRYETFGLVVLEAMLHGLPTAATAAGGVAELLVHGDTGLLSPPDEPAALAEHATALLTDGELAHRLGRNAAARARSTHLWEHILPRVLAVYAELTSS